MVRIQIIRTALDLFSQYGIKSVSMDDIARAAGISKRTLYELFDDKEALLMEAMTYTYNQYEDFLSKLMSENSSALDIIMLALAEHMKKPRWYSEKFFDDLNRYPKALAMMEERKKENLEKSMKLLGRGVKEGEFRSDINYEILAHLGRDHMQMMKRPVKIFSKFSISDIYSTVAVIFLRGICTDKGREKLELYILKYKIEKDASA